MGNVLNCSKNGDTSVHPFVYKVCFYGIEDTVQNLFTMAKRDKTGRIATSHDSVAYLRIKNRAIPKELAPEFFFAIWYQAIYGDKELRKKLLQYD